jgi:hypothetical protein
MDGALRAVTPDGQVSKSGTASHYSTGCHTTGTSR